MASVEFVVKRERYSFQEMTGQNEEGIMMELWNVHKQVNNLL